jgi:hypothetical protein
LVSLVGADSVTAAVVSVTAVVGGGIRSVAVVLSLALVVLSFLGARGFLVSFGVTLTSTTWLLATDDMVKEMVRRVNCFEVVRIKKVQFFAKK